MSIITESLIRTMKENAAAAIAAEGSVVFGGDATLQAVFDLAIEGLKRPDETAAVADVRRERERQVEVERRMPEQDDVYVRGELAYAAASYATHSATQHDKGVVSGLWPWEGESFKHCDPRRALVKAGALIQAEIERLDRAEARKQS